MKRTLAMTLSLLYIGVQLFCRLAVRTRSWFVQLRTASL